LLRINDMTFLKTDIN